MSTRIDQRRPAGMSRRGFLAALGLTTTTAFLGGWSRLSASHDLLLEPVEPGIYGEYFLFPEPLLRPTELQANFLEIQDPQGDLIASLSSEGVWTIDRALLHKYPIHQEMLRHCHPPIPGLDSSERTVLVVQADPFMES
jgi:hypothetical protein